MKRCRAFTIVELTIAVLVMLVMISVATLSPTAVRQSAKSEAEKLQAYIYRTMQKADRIHKNFYLEFLSGFVRVNWHDISTVDDSFKISDTCQYSQNFTDGKAQYNANKNCFITPGTITIKDSSGHTYLVIIAGITEGRIRISPQ